MLCAGHSWQLGKMASLLLMSHLEFKTQSCKKKKKKQKKNVAFTCCWHQTGTQKNLVKCLTLAIGDRKLKKGTQIAQRGAEKKSHVFAPSMLAIQAPSPLFQLAHGAWSWK
jgi:hypothetical protein